MKERLSKNNWLDHGLQALMESGANALRADSLAKALKVSRGSFYWHFKDIKQYQMDVLAHWQQRTTGQVIERMETQPRNNRLPRLIKLALNIDTRMERAIRSWASHNTEVAATIAKVDQQRLTYLEQLLLASGVNNPDAASRARIIYWAYLGHCMILNPEHESLPDTQIDAIADLLMHKSG